MITSHLKKLARWKMVNRADFNQQKKLVARAERLNFFLKFIDRPETAVALAESVSQLQQDVFALTVSGFKRGGYFVEFGATDGLLNSNSWLLEKKFGWSGILAEPAQCWQSSLRANRSAIIDSRAVWSESGKSLAFWETENPELSTLAESSASDHHRSHRRRRTEYEVETVSLNDLLGFHKAPRKIDLLSVDTEGSELQVLEQFDFSKFSVSTLVVEHNFNGERAAIQELCEAQGFVRVLDAATLWDDWYVGKEFAHVFD